MTSETFDNIIIGSGITALTIAAMLVKNGEKVLILEAHDKAGGYAHNFQMGNYWFNAQVHYIFGCGEEGIIYQFLKEIGLEKEVEFSRLDPEGFDKIVFPGQSFKIPNGWEKFCEKMVLQFPKEKKGINKYFNIIRELGFELKNLPEKINIETILTGIFKFNKLIKYKNLTLQNLFDECRLSPDIQTILAGQAGDVGLSPDRLSLLAHTGLVLAYDNGAYYPVKHYRYFIDSIVNYIVSNGGEFKYNTYISRFNIENNKVTYVEDLNGERYIGTRYISNIDPKFAVNNQISQGNLKNNQSFINSNKYDYSFSGFTVYLGLKNIKLQDYGFGKFNTWIYPENNINEIYRRHANNDYSNPWLFISTPTQHSKEEGIAPLNCEILEIATGVNYKYWKELKERDVVDYYHQKIKLQNMLIDYVAKNYIPDLKKHIETCFSGTPTTNEHFVNSPEGNSYGEELTPKNVNQNKIKFTTPFTNLYFANATRGLPGVGGTVATGMSLFSFLENKKV